MNCCALILFCTLAYCISAVSSIAAPVGCDSPAVLQPTLAIPSVWSSEDPIGIIWGVANMTNITEISPLTIVVRDALGNEIPTMCVTVLPLVTITAVAAEGVNSGVPGIYLLTVTAVELGRSCRVAFAVGPDTGLASPRTSTNNTLVATVAVGIGLFGAYLLVKAAQFVKHVIK